MKNDEFYDFFPGLSQSSEVYFGSDAPLAKLLIKYSTDLKTCIGNAKDFKNKKMVAELARIVKGFNADIAKELNCERVQLCINPDPTDNAAAYSMNFRADLNDAITDENGYTKTYLNLEKVIDQEDIVITSQGYKFRDPKSKILILLINTGTIQHLSVDQIAGTLAHELGHCFQQGIFGLYQAVADKEISYRINKSMKFTRSMANGSFKSSFKLFLNYLILPIHMIRNLSQAIKGKVFKERFSSVVGTDPVKAKDILKNRNNGDKDITKDKGFQTVSDTIIHFGSNSAAERNALADSMYEETQDRMKEYEVQEGSPERTRSEIYNFFRSINANINTTSLKVLHVISLSNYNLKQWEKTSFYKKYEYFADIFAASYGFGPHLYKNYVATEFEYIKALTDKDLVGVNNPKMLKLAYMHKQWYAVRRLGHHDAHGTWIQRGRAMYTALVKELETNPHLSSQQKKEIEASIKSIQTADETFYTDQKEYGGFWKKYYEEVINDRIDGIDRRTEKEILEPIRRVAKETMKKI